MALTVHTNPSPIQHIELTCSVEPELDSLTIRPHDQDCFIVRAKREPNTGHGSYVSLVLPHADARELADALVRFADEVSQ